MWAICDVALGLILTKVNTYDGRDFPVDARIPSMYFQTQSEDFHNTRLYIPEDMYNLTGSNSSSSKKALLASNVSILLEDILEGQDGITRYICHHKQVH